MNEGRSVDCLRLRTAQMNGSPDTDAKTMGQSLARSLEKCTARVVVAKFKAGWCKNTWGPQTNVDYDVLKTASIRWPYRIVVSYTMVLSVSKDHKAREEAEQDTKPSLIFKYSYKNVYEMTDDGSLRLSEARILPPSQPSRSESTRPLPSACGTNCRNRSSNFYSSFE